MSSKTISESKTLLPAERCSICAKTLKEIGGRRLTATKLRGVYTSNSPRDEGNQNYYYKSALLTEKPQLYMNIWGEESKWTGTAIERAKSGYLSGYRTWFCQSCGNRLCRSCASPINVPMGYDVLNDDGSSPHIGIYPFSSGCINTECTNHSSAGSDV